MEDGQTDSRTNVETVLIALYIYSAHIVLFRRWKASIRCCHTIQGLISNLLGLIISYKNYSLANIKPFLVSSSSGRNVSWKLQPIYTILNVCLLFIETYHHHKSTKKKKTKKTKAKGMIWWILSSQKNTKSSGMIHSNRALKIHQHANRTPMNMTTNNKITLRNELNTEKKISIYVK